MKNILFLLLSTVSLAQGMQVMHRSSSPTKGLSRDGLINLIESEHSTVQQSLTIVDQKVLSLQAKSAHNPHIEQLAITRAKLRSKLRHISEIVKSIESSETETLRISWRGYIKAYNDSLAPLRSQSAPSRSANLSSLAPVSVMPQSTQRPGSAPQGNRALACIPEDAAE